MYKEREVWLYFKWMPSNPEYRERYIVAAAVSIESIVVPLAEEVTKAQLFNIGITTIMLLGAVAVVVQNGRGAYAKH